MKHKKFVTLDEMLDRLYPTLEDKKRFEIELEEFIEENRKELLAELGTKLKKARVKKGMTQEELATKMNTDKANISRIEHGGHNMTVEYLMKIAHLLGRPVIIDIK